MSGSQFSGSSSSSRRGKKNSGHSSDKPKQPQRGLGVAQLEKIRIHTQMQEEMKLQTYAAMGVSPTSHFAYPTPQPSNSPYEYHPHIMMSIGDMERANLRFGEEQQYNQTRWNPSSQVYPENQQYAPQGGATIHLLDNMEDPGQSMRRNFWFNKKGSGSQNPGSSDSQDLDLELRL